MKKYPLLLLIALLSLSSCATYTSWNRTTTGAYVGSMFGSLIGDIVGGPRGSAVGSLIGGAAGAAVGAASAQKHDKAVAERYQSSDRRHDSQNYTYDNDIYYDNGRNYSYVAPTAPADYLEISNIVFADYNDNRILEGGETAYVTFDIRNTSGRTIYNVAPIISCDNRRINISPTATIAQIDAGRGMRYKAVIQAQRNVRSGQAVFNIGFAQQGSRLDPARSFRINVRR